MRICFESKFNKGDGVKSVPRSPYQFSGTVVDVFWNDDRGDGFVYEIDYDEPTPAGKWMSEGWLMKDE